MKYKKIKRENYNIHYIKSNRFKVVSIVLFLTKEFDKNDIKFGSLLCNNMLYTTKKYNTKNKIAIAGEQLYGCKVSASYSLTGKLESYAFSLDFLNPKYSKSEYLDKSLNFFEEVLFNPNIENNGFNKEYFDILMKDAILKSKMLKDNPNSYSMREFLKLMYKGTPTEYIFTPSEEELSEVTPENLYEFYKSLFNGEYKIDIAIHGDVDESIIELVDNKFKNKLVGNNQKMRFMINHKYDDKLIEKIDVLPFKQSTLLMGYRLNNLTDYELNYVLKVYTCILGIVNDSLLFKIVREDNSLCYSIGASYNKYNPAIIISAGINKDNYEKTVELIKVCMEKMKDKESISHLFEASKKYLGTSFNRHYDDLSSQVNYYFDKEFADLKEIETIRKIINKVTIEEVIEFNKKISPAVIYLLKGDDK